MESRPGESKEVEEYAQVAQIGKEETQVLWEKYSTQEYEGLERFEGAMSMDKRYSSAIATSDSIDELSSLIGQTDRKL